jgi:hypothetical protein
MVRVVSSFDGDASAPAGASLGALLDAEEILSGRRVRLSEFRSTIAVWRARLRESHRELVQGVAEAVESSRAVLQAEERRAQGLRHRRERRLLSRAAWCIQYARQMDMLLSDSANTMDELVQWGEELHGLHGDADPRVFALKVYAAVGIPRPR